MAKKYFPKKRKHKRKHGFLVRKKTPSGRKVLRKRRQKGRKRVAS